MARGRKNLKKRGPKVRRKQKNHSRFIKGTHTDEYVKRNWDYSKSQHENYKALGLVLSHQTRQQVTKINEEGIGPIVEIVPPEAQIKLDLSHDRGASRKKPGFVSADEAEYLGKLIAKHGDDYKAMERDIKTNPYQHTKAYLRRRCVRLLNWRKSQAEEAQAILEAEE